MKLQDTMHGRQKQQTNKQRYQITQNSYKGIFILKVLGHQYFVYNYSEKARITVVSGEASET